jgi:flagellar hook protein FlgE
VLQSSASSTDIGIEGAGFFVTRDGIGAGSNVAYTRAGSFTPDSAGYLKNAGGYYLQGWALDAQGNYANNGNLSALVPVRVSQLTGTAAATSNVQLRANLESTAAAFTGTYVAGDLAAGTTPAQFSRSVDIADAQGGTHAVTMAFLKTGPNAWVGEIYATPATDVTAAGGLLASGTVLFNSDGSLDRAGSATARPVRRCGRHRRSSHPRRSGCRSAASNRCPRPRRRAKPADTTGPETRPADA